ncbi:DUF2306 domain-containing protein [Nibribacter koreensis]|uniref:DUF2306 domain-containing protein n=1 Tax=Nibribacter koreensis TaxID=1084519 RepID=UPI0031EB2032
MARITWPYLSFKYDVDFLLTKQSILHIVSWRIAFYTHITSSLLVLVTGLFQFVRHLLLHYPAVHKWAGRIYVAAILLVSAPSGLVMAFYASGGFWAKLSFGIISVLWWYFTWQGYRKAVTKDIPSHQAFMYRSYALTLSAITLRTLAWLLPFFSHIHHLHGREMYVWIAWLSWIPNLLIAEWLIKRRRLPLPA